MPQFVVEFGAAKAATVASVILEQVPKDLSVWVLRTETSDYTYEELSLSAEEAVSALLAGTIASAMFRPRQGNLRYALILPPHFRGQQLSVWSGTLEWTDEGWRSSWQALLKHAELTFITVGREEGPEVSDLDVNNDSSGVWRSFPTIVTALRSPDGKNWIVISNPSSGTSMTGGSSTV